MCIEIMEGLEGIVAACMHACKGACLPQLDASAQARARQINAWEPSAHYLRAWGEVHQRGDVRCQRNPREA